MAWHLGLAIQSSSYSCLSAFGHPASAFWFFPGQLSLAIPGECFLLPRKAQLRGWARKAWDGGHQFLASAKDPCHSEPIGREATSLQELPPPQRPRVKYRTPRTRCRELAGVAHRHYLSLWLSFPGLAVPSPGVVSTWQAPDFFSDPAEGGSLENTHSFRQALLILRTRPTGLMQCAVSMWATNACACCLT